MPLVRLSKMSCIASVLATACVGTRGNEGRASKATTVDTEIVFVASDKAAGDFPQVKDSSRILPGGSIQPDRSEEHTSELQSLAYIVCRLLLEKKKINPILNS